MYKYILKYFSGTDGCCAKVQKSFALTACRQMRKIEM